MGTRKPEDIRSIALISHGGAGKTTLNEAFLFDAGLVSRMGKVEDKNRNAVFPSAPLSRRFLIKTKRFIFWIRRASPTSSENSAARCAFRTARSSS